MSYTPTNIQAQGNPSMGIVQGSGVASSPAIPLVVPIKRGIYVNQWLVMPNQPLQILGTVSFAMTPGADGLDGYSLAYVEFGLFSADGTKQLVISDSTVLALGTTEIVFTPDSMDVGVNVGGFNLGPGGVSVPADGPYSGYLTASIIRN